MKLLYALLLTAIILPLTGCATTEDCKSCKVSHQELNLQKLSAVHIAEVRNLVAKLEPFIKAKDQAGELPSLTFAELESQLDLREIQFLQQFREIRGSEIGVSIPFREFSEGRKDLVRIAGQKIRVKGEIRELPPQFLPPHVFKAYTAMMDAMQQDLGKRLLVESGYRSSAYQLYLFIFYLSNHDYSIRETSKWVALPGYSEHGSPHHQAVDFMNEEGVNGEEDVKDFEVLTEYAWLLKNASRFGFTLSYPKTADKGITYEPWHWRYDTDLESPKCGA